MTPRTFGENPGERAEDADPSKRPVTVEDLELLVEELRSQLRWTRLIGALLYAFSMGALAVVGGFLLKEGAQREDGQCRIFEGQQRMEREELGQTYDYLLRAQLHPREFDQTLRELVTAQLPTTYQRALDDQAPAYCDADDVGEDEPDPPMPVPPAGLKLPDGYPPSPPPKPPTG